MFNLEKLCDFALEAIHNFVPSNEYETFYAFALDGESLCLNCEQACYETFLNYVNTATKSDEEFYASDEGRRGLRLNVGSWRYQRFAAFNEESGWDVALYAAHLKAKPKERLNSDYAKAMNALLDELKRRQAFKTLKRTDDFVIMIVEHK